MASIASKQLYQHCQQTVTRIAYFGNSEILHTDKVDHFWVLKLQNRKPCIGKNGPVLYL